MPTFEWTRHPTKHFGMVWVPIAQIELQNGEGRFKKFAVQIDSGATISLLRRSAADLLGIELKSGSPVDLTSVGNAKTIAYVHQIMLRIEGMPPEPVPFAIADTESVPVLLGRLGFFDRLQVDFDASLCHTRIGGVWLPGDWREIWETLIEIEGHILARVNNSSHSPSVNNVIARFLRRGCELVAGAAGLAKLGRESCGGLLLMRAIFELAAQFKYLMSDPETLCRDYQDYANGM